MLACGLRNVECQKLNHGDPRGSPRLMELMAIPDFQRYATYLQVGENSLVTVWRRDGFSNTAKAINQKQGRWPSTPKVGAS